MHVLLCECTFYSHVVFQLSTYSRTPLIRPPSESHWCGRIRGWSLVRDSYTNRNHCLSHEMWSYERDGRWWGWSFVRGSTVLSFSHPNLNLHLPFALLLHPSIRSLFSIRPSFPIYFLPPPLCHLLPYLSPSASQPLLYSLPSSFPIFRPPFLPPLLYSLPSSFPIFRPPFLPPLLYSLPSSFPIFRPPFLPPLLYSLPSSFPIFRPPFLPPLLYSLPSSFPIFRPPFLPPLLSSFLLPPSSFHLSLLPFPQAFPLYPHSFSSHSSSLPSLSPPFLFLPSLLPSFPFSPLPHISPPFLPSLLPSPHHLLSLPL